MKLMCAVAALAAIAASPVYADCTAPQAPQNLPDGNTATLQQMVAGQKAVKAYNDATNAYLTCLSNDHKAALQAAGGDKATADEKAKLDQTETTKHNAAVDQLTSVANQFNEQVRIWKAKNGKG